MNGAQDLVNPLKGIASCATKCGCCEMHVRIAEKVLGEAAEFFKGFDLAVVCRRCGEHADPESHVCKEACEL